MKEIGYNFLVSLDSSGFYPQGEGKVNAVIQPNTKFKPLQKIQRGKLLSLTGISFVANLDKSIASRQKLKALKMLYETDLGIDNTKIRIKSTYLPSRFKGTGLFLKAEYENGLGGFSSLGRKGKPAEKVAEEAVNKLLVFHREGGAVDMYMADQLLLPLSLVQAKSRFSTQKITNHFLTNREIILKFLPVNIASSQNNDGKICISVNPDL
jgi:RNA 3'-terminal phosphate cyclase (ATP)